MDTTFLGGDFGVMVFRGLEWKEGGGWKEGKEQRPIVVKEIEEETKLVKKPKRKLSTNPKRKPAKNLYWIFTKSERIKDYDLGLFVLQKQYQFKSFTIDNKSGLIKMLERKYPCIPIQLCQFHMVQTVFKYITRRPKDGAGKDLRKLILSLKRSSKKEFKEALYIFLQKHVSFIQERNYKGEYIHKNIRNAIAAIQTNFSYLFTFENYPSLNIPKTNNSSEGSFGHWKYKVKIHRGLKPKRKQKLIEKILMER